MLIIEIITLVALMFGSAFFSGVETAFTSISPATIHRLVENKVENARKLQKLRENYDHLIITLLIGNNLVNIAASSLATVIGLEFFGSNGVGVAIGVMTFIVLVWGEITPKTIAMAKNEKICLMTAPIIKVLYYILMPAVLALEKFTHLISNMFIDKNQIPSHFTEEEIKSAVTLAEKHGDVEEDEKEMIHNIFKFSDLKATNILIPLKDVFWVENEQTIEEIIPKIMRRRYSRVPVFCPKDHEFKGVIHLKDLFKVIAQKDTKKKVKEVMKNVIFIPEDIHLDDLLDIFQSKKKHIAIVKNNHDVVIGIITIEDLLEEIVGDIYDETDFEKDLIKPIKNDKNCYLIKGDATLNEMHRICNYHIKNKKKKYKTLESQIRNKLKHDPKVGDTVQLSNAKIKITNLNPLEANVKFSK